MPESFYTTLPLMPWAFALGVLVSFAVYFIFRESPSSKKISEELELSIGEYVVIKPYSKGNYYAGYLTAVSSGFYHLSPALVIEDESISSVIFRKKIKVDICSQIIEIISADDFFKLDEMSNNRQVTLESRYDGECLITESEVSPNDNFRISPVPVKGDHLLGKKVLVIDGRRKYYGVFFQVSGNRIILSDVVVMEKDIAEPQTWEFHSWLWIGALLSLKILPLDEREYQFQRERAYDVTKIKPPDAEMALTADEVSILL